MEAVLKQLEETLLQQEAELINLQQQTSIITKSINKLRNTIALLKEQEQSSCSTIEQPNNPSILSSAIPSSTPAVPSSSSTPQSLDLLPRAHNKSDEAKESKFYVIYNGPQAGIYDQWHQAAIHITGKSSIIHKSFATKIEAEKSLQEFQKTSLRPQYKTVLINSSPTPPNMTVLGKTIDLERINSLPTRSMEDAINQGARIITAETFCDHFQSLNEWIPEYRSQQFYPQNRGRFGPKAIIFPGAEALTTYLFFQCGLIDTIYVQDLKILADFPVGFINAVKQYKDRFAKDREVFLKVYSSYPIFEVSNNCSKAAIKVHRIAYIQIGVSNGIYPPVDEPPKYEFHWDIINKLNLNCLEGIFHQCSKINNDTLLKINYKGPQMILVSAFKQPMTTEGVHLIQAFSQPFTHMDTIFIPLSEAWKKAICQQLREYTAHRCTYCPQPPAQQTKEDTTDDTTIIIEE